MNEWIITAFYTQSLLEGLCVSCSIYFPYLYESNVIHCVRVMFRWQHFILHIDLALLWGWTYGEIITWTITTTIYLDKYSETTQGFAESSARPLRPPPSPSPPLPPSVSPCLPQHVPLPSQTDDHPSVLLWRVETPPPHMLLTASVKPQTLKCCNASAVLNCKRAAWRAERMCGVSVNPSDHLCHVCAWDHVCVGEDITPETSCQCIWGHYTWDIMSVYMRTLHLVHHVSVYEDITPGTSCQCLWGHYTWDIISVSVRTWHLRHHVSVWGHSAETSCLCMWGHYIEVKVVYVKTLYRGEGCVCEDII